MKLSYFMMPLHGLDKDYHKQLLEDMEAIIHADELGYTEAWVGEHYSSGVETITSPLMFLTNLIPRTKQIKLATGVICMPQYHPATIAGQAAMFDHLCDGRFILGIGPGGLPPDFELFGTMDADRNEMFIESIDTVLRYWTTDPPYNFEGKYWKSKIEQWTVPELKLGYMAKPRMRTGRRKTTACLCLCGRALCGGRSLLPDTRARAIQTNPPAELLTEQYWG